jgi:hypothetical protein
MQTSYRVAVWRPLLHFGAIALFTAVTPFVVISVIDGDNPPGALLLVALVAWFWFAYSTLFAYRVDVDGNDVEFRFLARRRRSQLSDISLIRSQSDGMVKIKFARRWIYVFDKTKDWDEFVGLVEEANPNVKVSQSPFDLRRYIEY